MHPEPKNLGRHHSLCITIQVPGFSKCLLDFGIQPGDLDDLFVSSSWPLCQIVDGLGLPDCSIEACNNLVTDHEFDRLIIHTDGSSHSGRLHRSTAYIEACAIPDAWAFLVIGEKYQPNGKSRLTMLGWMAHQVRYDELNPFHLGATAANPLIAEREALTWAFIWRILLNSTIPTTFRTDSLTSGGSISASKHHDCPASHALSCLRQPRGSRALCRGIKRQRRQKVSNLYTSHHKASQGHATFDPFSVNFPCLRHQSDQSVLYQSFVFDLCCPSRGHDCLKMLDSFSKKLLDLLIQKTHFRLCTA
jgi:hypothetical protein